jgi:hypothetical protein
MSSIIALHSKNSVRSQNILLEHNWRLYAGRRRKEHLRNLEQAQKEQNSKQLEEIERLRCQNDQLRRENEGLRAQTEKSFEQSNEIECIRYENDELRRENEGLRTQIFNPNFMPADGRFIPSWI